MLKWRQRALFLVLAVVAAGLIAGCGGDENKNEPPQELEEQLGFSRLGIMERQSQVENKIRDCMKAQGFDYVPIDPFAQQQALTGKARQSEEDFIKDFGYGISTLFGRGGQQADPNDKIRAGLSSDADRAAYDRALYGDNPGVTFAEAVDSGDFSELGGCTKEATYDVFGGGAVLNQLVSKLDELDERIAQDQRMIDAQEKWAECMSEKGFRYEEPDEIDEDLAERFRSIVGVGVRPGATKAEPGTSYDRAALADLQREEVKIANADLACERQEITPVERVVRPQYEKTFRQQNQQLLTRVPKVGS